MVKQRWFCWVLVIGLLGTPGLACSSDQATLTISPQPTSAVAMPTDTPEATRFIPIVPTATLTADLPTPTSTLVLSGPAVVDVQFALEVDPEGQLVFPATEFVSGVTRVYVRFSYSELGQVGEAELAWYLNDNRVSGSLLEWDGGDEGEYLIWLEDPNGLNRGQWRWEFISQDAVLGSGSFTIGEEPRYVSDAWGIGLDPPAGWSQVSEATDYVAFSSSDQQQGIALHAAVTAADLAELAMLDVELFRADHPDAEIVSTEDVTMNGEPALLQRVRYQDPERGEQILFIVSALHGGLGYGLWVLGPPDEGGGLEALLADTLLSIQFLE